jgi:putative oxidoreductase
MLRWRGGGHEGDTAMTRDLGLLLRRLGAGATLMAHGYPKLFGGPEKAAPEPAVKVLGPKFEEAVQTGGPESFAQTLTKLGVPDPQVAAVLSRLAEFGGGLGLALGLFTRQAGLAAAANMAVAARKAHWPQGFYGQGGYEFPLLLGLVAGALAMTGPGAISIDHVLGRD